MAIVIMQHQYETAPVVSSRTEFQSLTYL